MVDHPNLPKALRELADAIEKKNHYILGAALVVDSSVSGIETHYIGNCNDNHHAHILFNAGAAETLRKLTDRWY